MIKKFLVVLGVVDMRQLLLNVPKHGLWTPNEGINQRYLKNWACVADKICFGRAVKAISSLGVRSPWYRVSKKQILLEHIVANKRERVKMARTRHAIYRFFACKVYTVRTVNNVTQRSP